MGRDMNAISPAPQLESGLPTTSITALETREEAVNKAMRSLEGDRHAHPERARPSQRDVLGTISRPAPSPPRPRSLEAALSSPDVEKPVDPRRSLGLAYNPPGRLRSDVEGKVATSEVTSGECFIADVELEFNKSSHDIYRATHGRRDHAKLRLLAAEGYVPRSSGDRPSHAHIDSFMRSYAKSFISNYCKRPCYPD